MKRKCKVCKKRFNLKKENKYQIYVAPVGLNCIVEGGKTFEAFDCPMCGCQNIVNAGIKNRYRVVELNRLAMAEGRNGNDNASFLVSHSLKMLPNYTFVVSYADTGWGHVGYIYQACNFLYTGVSAKRLDTFTNGKHSRSRDKAETRHQTRNSKHRYIYLVGNKKEKKQMLSELKYPIQPYPKGESRHYDIHNPQIVIPIKIIE